MGFLRRLFGRDIKTDTAVQNGYTLVADDTKTSGIDWSDVLVRGGLGRDLFTGMNNINSSTYNIDTTLLPGEYYFGEATLGTKPSTYGLLKVWRESSEIVYQIVQSSQMTPNKMFSRYYGAGSWGPWTDYSSSVSPYVTYSEGNDIDATFTPGEYYYGVDTLGDTPSTYGLVKVWRESSAQVYQLAQSSDKTPNRMFSRYYSAGSWGPWTDYSSNVSPSATYIGGSVMPGDPDVTYTVLVRGTTRIIVTTGGGGGGGGGGAGAGASIGYDGWPGTGGGAGVKAILEYCSDSTDIYNVDMVITAAADGGIRGIGDGGQPGAIQQPGGDGRVGASVSITIKGSNPITLEGGRPGKGGYQYIAGSRTVQGSGVGTSLVSCLGNYLEVGASIPLNSGTLTVTYISTGGSQSITFDPATAAPLAGGEGVAPATLGYDRDRIAGGAAGTPFVNGGDGSYPILQSQVGYGGGGGGSGASGNGGTAGGKGGKGSRGCVTVYSYV